MSKLTNEQIVDLFIRTCEEATIDNIVDLPYVIYENKYSNLSIYRTDTSIYLESYTSNLVKYDVEYNKFIINQEVADKSNTTKNYRYLFLAQAPSYKIIFNDHNTITALMNGTISQNLKRARSEDTINSTLKKLKEVYDYLEYLDDKLPQYKSENSDKLQQEIVKLFFSKGRELC